MKHEIYSCDWCGVAAPKVGEHPSDWKTFEGGAEYIGLPAGTVATLLPAELLCGECRRTRAEYIAQAKVERQHKRNERLTHKP
jgi:hypothetical protein